MGEMVSALVNDECAVALSHAIFGGGSKGRQDADIGAAVERWKRYKQTQA
jgi:hypothetical protein